MVDVLILLELCGKDDFSSPFFTRSSLKLLEFVGEFSSFIVIFYGRFSYFFYETERPSYASQLFVIPYLFSNQVFQT